MSEVITPHLHLCFPYLINQFEYFISTAKTWQSWYPDHINGNDHSAVFVRASESPRCHETAQALLKALFSEEEFCPVPVYGPPPGYDKYVSLEGYGKNINEMIAEHYPVSLLFRFHTTHFTLSENLSCSCPENVQRIYCFLGCN